MSKGSFVYELNRAFRESGLTLTEFAEKTGLDRSYLYRVLRGDVSPSIDRAEEIATALGLSVTVK